jgi:F-type H+-transporting ATPase subunit alpha
VYAAGGDITAFLPTNVMSITDGQWILDMDIFRDRMRPAVSVGLSVSRVGGRGQDARQKQLAGQVFKTLTAYAQAQEFAHFGSELAVAAQQDLARGDRLYKLLNQIPGERYSLRAQTLMLDVALNLGEHESLDIAAMKAAVVDFAAQIKDDKDYEPIRDQLKKKSLVEVKK